ncbi:MAG TPA: efflux RND transporter periplasmic adaptor subunit [Victivallales bacterium]|nr:efflux RND transporter periplasmic adaptor subunit [Victivallales bacterium]
MLRKHKKTKMILFSLTILPVILLTGCNTKINNTNTKSIPVNTAAVIEKSIPIYIDSFGNLSADSTVDIKTQVSGKLIKTYFDSGESVKRGTLLAEIDPETYQTQYDYDRAQLTNAVADYNLKKYYVQKNQKIASSGALAAQNYEKMKADLEMSAANVKIYQAKVKMDKINLQYCKIYSPLTGVIGLSSVSAGNVVAVNETLLNIKSINPLWVDFTLPSKNLDRLKKAISNNKLKVYITVHSLDKYGNATVNKIYEGSLNYLNNTTNKTASTISLSAEIPNEKLNLLPGEYVNVRVILGEEKGALLIPVSAVKVGPGGKYVYIVEQNNIVKQVYVTTGDRYDNNILVIKGNVKAGDKIVTVGQQNLYPGAVASVVQPDKSTSKTA